MALAVPLALKKLLGLQPPDADAVAVPASDGSATPAPPAVAKVFGPAVNPSDQAAAEAADPTAASAAPKIKVPLPAPLPAALKKVAAPEDPGAPPTMAAPNNAADVAGVTSARPTTDQLPELAPQGGTHAIPSMLMRLMGITAAQPKEGQLYNGPATDDDKLKAGVGFVGRLGNALASAAGTPEQKELAEKRSEFGPTLEATTELKKANLASIDAYRRGQLGNVADRNDINQQKADQGNQIAVAKMAKQAMVPDEQHPGAFRGMTPDEILTHPALAQEQDLKHSAMMVKNAQAALEQARTDVLLHPENYATYQQKERQIQATLKMAQSHLNNSLANTAIRAREGMWQFGENPLTGEQLNEGNAPPGMLTSDDAGTPVPYKQNSTYAPTANMRTMQGMAKTMPTHIQELRDLINEADEKGYVGPVAGRVYQDFLAGKVGSTGNPDADALLGNLKAADSLMSSAMMRTHYGGRGAQQAYDTFRNLLSSGGSKEMLDGTLDQFGNYVKGYSTAANPNITKPRGAGGTAAPTAAPAAASQTGKSYLFPDGKIRPVSPEMEKEAIKDGAREAK